MPGVGTEVALVNIGIDSGRSAGNELLVFRGNEYVGDLVITATDPKVAVGKFRPARRAAKLAVNDSVVTSFGGSGQ